MKPPIKTLSPVSTRSRVEILPNRLGDELGVGVGVGVGVVGGVGVGVGVGAAVTVTVKLQLAVFPVESETVLVTVVVPTGNDEPEGGFDTALPTPEQLSLVVGFPKVTTALFWPGAASVVILPGQEMVGAWVSTTVTVNEQFAPPAPLAVTVVAPFGKNAPLAGELVTEPQLPDELGAGYSTVAPHWFGKLLVVIFAGQVRTHVDGGGHAGNPETLKL